MAADLNVYGAAKLGAVAKRLKETGDKDLRKELYRGIQRAAKPVRPALVEAARRNLPKRGGVNEYVAAYLKTRISTLANRPNDAAVRVTTTRKDVDIRGINRGRLRHPVFGNRKVWADTRVKAGWFQETVKAEAPAIRAEIVKVLDEVAEKIARG